jgi:hypothetical protein
VLQAGADGCSIERIEGSRVLTLADMWCICDFYDVHIDDVVLLDGLFVAIPSVSS